MKKIDEQYLQVREFFLPRMKEMVGESLGAKLSDIESQLVRDFFNSYEFCKNWIADLAVPDVYDYAYDGEGIAVNKLAELYTMTEFGPILFERELFAFATSTSGERGLSASRLAKFRRCVLLGTVTTSFQTALSILGIPSRI